MHAPLVVVTVGRAIIRPSWSTVLLSVTSAHYHTQLSVVRLPYWLAGEQR